MNSHEQPAQDTHYLKRELYQLVQEEESIFDFLQNGSLDGLWYWDLENPEQRMVEPAFLGSVWL
jgi:hypothetical protein